jgi:hypothetical protein
MGDLVLSGGQVPCAADYEDLGSEIYSMVQRYESMRTTRDWRNELQAERQAERQAEQAEQTPKQAIWTLYGVFGVAIGTLAWLWTKMF